MTSGETAAGALFRRLGLLALLAWALLGPGWAVIAGQDEIAWWVYAGLAVLLAIALVRPAWSPLVLVGLVPLLPLSPSMAPGVPPGIVHLVVATQAVPWCVRRLWRPHGPGSAAATGWAVLVVVATVSVVVSITPEPWRGLDVAHLWRLVRAQVPAYVLDADPQHVAGAVPAWTVLLDGLVAALVVGWATTRDTRARVLAALSGAAIGTAVFGFVQAATGYGLQTAWQVFDAGIVRINATYVDPNALAAFYALVAPVLAGLALRAQGAARLAWGAGVGVVLVAVVMTAGRAGLGALAVGLFTMAAIGFAYRLDAIDPWPWVRRHARRVVARAALGVAAFLIGLTLVGTGLDIRHQQQTSYLHTWLYTFNLRQPPDAIAKGRLAVWQVARAMIAEHPLAGQGLGAAPVQFERVRAALGIDSLPRDARLSPHNTYLLVASELGVLGLAAFGVFLAAVVLGARSPGSLREADSTTWPVAGLLGGLAGYALTMLTGDRILLREDVVVGLSCAALATLGARPLPRAWRVAALVVVGAALLSWPIRTGWVGGTVPHPDLPPHEGLHPEQIGARGETYRWSTGDALLYVARDVDRVRIPLRNLSPSPQRVDVVIDDRPADRRHLEPGPWVTLEYRLPPPPAHRRWHTIRLRVTPTWRVPGDARHLGVVIGEWAFDRTRAANAEP